MTTLTQATVILSSCRVLFRSEISTRAITQSRFEEGNRFLKVKVKSSSHVYPSPSKANEDRRRPPSGNPSSTFSSAVSSWRTKTFEFRWQIRDLHREIGCEENNHYVTYPSPTFRVRDVIDIDGNKVDEIVIKLSFSRIDVDMDMHRRRDKHALRVSAVSSSPDAAAWGKCPNKVRFRFFDEEGEEKTGLFDLDDEEERYCRRFEDDGPGHSCDCFNFGFVGYVGQFTAGDLRRMRTLNIVMELKFVWGDTTTSGSGITDSGEGLAVEMTNPDFCSSITANLPRETRRLMTSKSLSDFTIVCQGREFPTIKFLLAAHSDYFKAMFEHPETDEVKTGRVVIDDVEPAVMALFLRFLGGDKIDPELLRRHAAGLFKAADKYNVVELRKVSRINMLMGIGWESCVDCIVCAHQHDDEAMMKAAVRVAARNKEDLLESDGWKNLEEKVPKLAMEVLKKMMGIGN